MLWYLLGILVVGFFYLKIIKPHKFWQEKGVKCTKPIFFFGDIWRMALKKESTTGLIQRVYTAFPEERFFGMYQMLMPILIIREPELLKQITVKDFDHFTDHIKLFDSEPLLAKNLFQLKGETWRNMRATLSPAFTSSKMKAMFVLMSECAEQFAAHFAENQEEIQTIELKDTFLKYTNDVIATCAFGIKCDSLRDKDNEFYLMGKEVANLGGIWTTIKLMLLLVMPNIAKRFRVKIISKRLYNFFINLISETVKTREEQNIVRPDMIHLLMEARKGALVHEEHQDSADTGFATAEESDIGKRVKTEKPEITLEDMTAQALIFFFAGNDSASNLMSFMGYELGVNPDIQERLRNEIDDTLRKCNGKITYEALNKMKYLDMVIAESLRKWPPAPMADRTCVLPYTIQSQGPNEPSVTLNKGDNIWIPIWGFHYDPQYYSEPERFDPERFSDENKNKIKKFTYLPFGTGQRNCIASRFALLETKIVYFHLLAKFEIVVIEKTQVPLKFSMKAFTMATDKPNINYIQYYKLYLYFTYLTI